MRVAVDLDGVVYDFHRTFRYMMREHRGVHMPPVEEFWHTWNAQEAYGTPEDHAWMWSEGIKRGLFRYGHMITGARIGLEALKNDGHKITIITHRPANAVSDTLDWIVLYFDQIELDGLHILSNGEAKWSVPGDILVDDKPSNVSEWSKQRKREAILFDRAHNRGAQEGLTVARDWREVVRIVGELHRGRH